MPSDEEDHLQKAAGKPAEEPRRTGRIPGPLEDLRSERLVQRIHPDLMSAVLQRCREAGFTRSQYVERILIAHMNAEEGADLDMIGKRRQRPSPKGVAPSDDKPPLDYAPPGIGPGLGKANDAFFRREPRPPRTKKK